MALMSVEEWRRKKEEKKQGTATASAPSVSSQRSSSQGSSGKASQLMTVAEWRAEKAKKSVDGWAESANALLNDVQNHYGRWRGKDDEEYTGYQDRISDLLAQADGWRKQYAGNKEAIASINSVVESLSDAKSYAYKYRDYYSRWETEKDYNDYLAYQKDYEEKSNYDIESAQKEIDALESELAVLKREEYLKSTYQNNPTGYYGAPKQTGSTDTSPAANQVVTGPFSYAVPRQTQTNAAPVSAPVATGPFSGATAAHPRKTYEPTERELRIDELEKLISQKTQYMNQAKNVQEGITLAGAVNNDDFEKYSGYVSTYGKDSFWSSFTGVSGMGYGDLTYEYINNQNGIRDEIKQEKQSYSADIAFGRGETIYEKNGYDYLKEDEIAIYNYYYAKEGKKKAQEYLDNIQETLNHRKATGMFEEMKGNTALELVFGLEAGIDQFASGIVNAFNFKDDYIAQTAHQIASGMVREDLADDGPMLPEWLGGESIGQAGYDVITTSANMAPSILASVAIGMVNPAAGKWVGSTLMGVSASGNAYQQALNEGFDKDQAKGYSILVGASEMVMEKALGGISALGGNTLGKAFTKNVANADNALKMIAKRLGGSMISEFSEEYLQEVLDPVFQNIMLGTDKDVKLFSTEALYAGFLGALTAGIMEGPTAISTEVKNYNTGKKLQDAGITSARLSEIGKTFAADTVAYQLAGKVDENTGAYAIGRLFNEIGATLTEQNVSEITEALVAKGMDEATARKNAEILAYVVEGGKLTDRDVAVIEANDALAEAARTTLIDANTTWNQRAKGYKDVLMEMAKEKASPKTAQTKAAETGASKAKPAEVYTDAVQNENAPNGTQTVEGRDINTVTQEAVSTDKIKTIAKDGLVFEQEDGSEVSSKDVDYADAEDGLIFEAFTEMQELGTDAANEIISIRRKVGGSGQMFANVMRIAYEYGYANLSETALLARTYRGDIPSEAVQRIYQIGKEARAAEDARRAQAKKSVTDGKTAVYRLTETGEVKQLGEGKEALKVLAVKERRSVGVQTAQFLQKIGVGGNYFFFQSYTDKDGKRVFVDRNGNVQEAHNGMYYSNGDIYIDLNAGTDSSGITLFTISHELAHFVQQWNAEKYKVLADFLAKHYAKNGISAYRAIKIKQQELTEARGKAVSFEEAYHEFVADSLSTMFSDGDIYEKLLDLKKTDKGTFNKIRSYINKLAQKAKLYYGGEIANTTEGMFMQMQSKETIDHLQQMFADALVGASENYRNAETQKNTDQGVGVQYSVMTDVYDSNGNLYKKVVKPGKTNYDRVKHDLAKYRNFLRSKVFPRKITIQEKNGDKWQIEFAREDEKVYKNGKGPHYVRAELEQAKMRLKMIASMDAKLLLLHSESTPHKNDNSHGWMDRNGWDDRICYMMVDNAIHKVVLHIANTDDGRHLLYDISVIKKEKAETTAQSTLTHHQQMDESAQKVRQAAGNQTLSGEILSQEDNFVNTQNSDVSSEPVSNRSLLANAFEDLAKDDTERKKIQEYKGQIDLINAEERKLSEIRAQIKELSFAKGPRDKKKLSALRDEATKTANRISIYDKKLLRLEASKPLQDVLAREKKRAYERADKKGKEALEAYREKALKDQKELTEKWQESRKKNVEGRRKTAVRHKIQNVVKELNDLLLNESKTRHVPDSLKKAVAGALALVNMDTVGAEERVAKYAALIAKEQAKAEPDQDKIDSYTVSMENILRQGEKMGQRMKELRDAYDEIQNSDDPDIANAYDPVIAGSLRELSQTIGDTSIRDMSIEQLSDVYDMYKMVLTRVRDANKAMAENIKESIDKLASGVVGEVRMTGGDHKYRVSMLDPVRQFLWNNLKPVYAMEHIGSSTLTRVFNNVRAGEDTWAKDVTEARAYYLDKSKKYGYDSWDFKKKYQFESDSGIPFELTLEQILSLYAYSKREQAHDHLRLGGFVFDSNIETYKERESKLIKYKVNTADAHQITPEIMADIIGTLSKEQTGFVDEMQDYLSTVMGAKGNEVTSKMYGVKLFKEKFYFPLKSAKQFMFEQNEVAGEVKIKNSGFTNKVVAKANNPVILSNFMDVWTGHVNDMSMYHAFTLPLEDFNRVFNYNSQKKEGQEAVSVKGTIQNAYSPAAVSYVKSLITDLNGGARTDSTAGFINKMMGLFKKGSVFASLSVVIQQPSAIARAAALVDLKYFIGPKVDHKRHKALWDEVKQYAPVAIIKEMGYFDTNMGKSTEDFITGKEYSGFLEKMKALVADSDYRDEILSKAPALADEIAWCGIWDAVKREMHDKHPGMDAKSEAFLKLAGERFTEVITKTQVYDSVLSRSANMRSKDTGMKMATAFMAEPTTSINMIADALLQGKRGNRKYARATIGAVIASQILNSILVSFVYAGRDDDEDETYWEKYIGTLTGEMLDSLNPAGYIPFIKDIVSIVQGYDVERSDMSVVSDLWKAWKNLSNDKVSTYRKVEGFAGSVAQIFGLPVKNIMRDARGIYQTVMSFMNGQQTTKAGIGYAIKGAITGKNVSDQQQLYDAILSGDQTQISRVRGRFKDESAVSSAIRKALRENDPRIREAAIAWNANNLDEYMRIAKEIVAEKHFVQDDVVMAIRAEASALTPDDGTTGTSKAKGMFTTEKFAEAIAQGDQATAAAIKADVIQTAQKNGKTAEEAEESFENSAKGDLKEMFLAGDITESKAVDALVTFCGDEREDAGDRVGEWAFEKEYGFSYSDRADAYMSGEISREKLKEILMEQGGQTAEEADLQIQAYDWQKQGFEGVTMAAVRDYNEHCADAGVPKDTYLYIRKFSNNTDNDVDPATGKTIYYSAMKKVMAEINAQRITAAQKTAIARSLGWSEKNIQKYKLW